MRQTSFKIMKCSYLNAAIATDEDDKYFDLKIHFLVKRSPSNKLNRFCCYPYLSVINYRTLLQFRDTIYIGIGECMFQQTICLLQDSLRGRILMFLEHDKQIEWPIDIICSDAVLGIPVRGNGVMTFFIRFKSIFLLRSFNPSSTYSIPHMQIIIESNLVRFNFDLF